MIYNPKVLLVGDQRYMTNWGGRGQSIALYSLLSSEFPVSDVVYGSGATSVIEFDEYLRSLLPRRIGNLVNRIREKSRSFDFCLDMGKVVGAKNFVTNRPEQSLRNLLKHMRTSPRLSSLYDQVGRADVVVINGEGSGIFRTPFRGDFFFYLAMIELASHLNKHVFYVNGIISDCPNTGRNVDDVQAANGSLAKCDAVLVRDFQSLEYVNTVMKGVNCHFLPDALFLGNPAWRTAGATCRKMATSRFPSRKNRSTSGNWISPNPTSASGAVPRLPISPIRRWPAMTVYFIAVMNLA